MSKQFLPNYTETTFLEKIKDDLRHYKFFYFSVSFIKKAGLVLLYKDIVDTKWLDKESLYQQQILSYLC